jgi:predicted MFS family arabinose efflux permease
MTFARYAARRHLHPPAAHQDGDLRTALGLALGPAVALGFARFAYALLLPPMRSDLGWSFSVAGAMNTANAVGYLVGALVAAWAARRFGSRRVFLTGVAVTALALGLSATSGDLIVLLALRVLAGAAGSVSFAVGGGLAAQLSSRHSPSRAAVLLGVYFAGGGVGIVASGLVIPAVLASTPSDVGWRASWLLLGVLSILALAATIAAVRRVDEPPRARRVRGRGPIRALTPLIAAYLLFGAGYISYMTFIVAFLASEGANPGSIASFWVVLGAAAIAAPFVWAPVLARLRGGRGPVGVLLVLVVGALLPLLFAAPWAGFGSAILFGGSFLTVVTAVAAVARASLHPRHWTPAIAALTVAFALGQCIGPILAGVLSDGPDGVRAGLAVSVGILVLSMIVALGQQSRVPSEGICP